MSSQLNSSLHLSFINKNLNEGNKNILIPILENSKNLLNNTR